jgi:chromosome segregation ATPase
VSRNYVGRIDKIQATRTQIEVLSQSFDCDIPMLQQKWKEVEKMRGDLQAKQGKVEDTRAQVKEQNEVGELEVAAVAETNRVSQEKHAQTQPILEAAQGAVDSMGKYSLVNIKAFK